MKHKKTRSPWSWIPTLYFAQGLPYVAVMTVSVIMYKRFGLSNTDIALYTSWLYLPWVIKPFWSPFVDILKTKRWWIISMQLLIGAGLAGIAFTLPTPFYFKASLAFFWLMAFSSATHDIAADGFYMLALDDSQQSFFVGIRSTFYRLAMITGQGLLIILAGGLELATGLDPVDIQISSSNSIQREIIYDNTSNITNSELEDELTFIYPENLIINTNKISSDSLKKIKSFVQEHNVANGFILQEKELKKEKKVTWWSENVAVPLGNYLKKHFGEKKKEVETSLLVGNVGVIPIQLNRSPDKEKEVVLNTNFSKGNKNISLIAGSRITFNAENWNKPAYIIVQLDSRVNNEISTNLRGASGNIPLAWSLTFFILAGLFLLFFVYHRFILPYPDSDSGKAVSTPTEVMIEFGRTFSSFFKKKGIGLAMAFILLYRLAEAMLVKLASPFLLDGRDVGGIGLTTQEVGIAYGTFGVIALTLGGIIGGIVASRQGLKYWLWPMALAITLPNAAYLILAFFQPESFFWVNVAVSFEQLGYGFGFTAYMLFLIYFSQGEHKTAHYSICTGFMALGMMLPGMAAGWIQEQLGYQNFFILVMILTIPTLLLIPFMKIDKEFGKSKKEVEE
jgi:PAT family beta-lactamase induction signal transducer AmpG